MLPGERKGFDKLKNSGPYRAERMLAHASPNSGCPSHFLWVSHRAATSNWFRGTVRSASPSWGRSRWPTT
jgi:hypothetical protein